MLGLGGIHPIFLAVLLAIVLIIFGPGKLPELGGAIGRSIREFRRASNDLTDEVRHAMEKRGRDDFYPTSSENMTDPNPSEPAEHGNPVSDSTAKPAHKPEPPPNK